MPGYVIPDNLPSNLMVYARMLKVGLAKQSVLNKMNMDGVPEEMFLKYLDPDRPQEEAPPAAVEEDDEFASDEEKDAENPLYGGGDTNETNNPPSTGGDVIQSDPLAIEPAKVDMSGMNPMPVKKTLIMVNAFVADSVTFLNRFVATCDERLHEVDQRIEKMKLRMLILENNINSIEWLRTEPETAPAAAAAPAAPAQAEAATSTPTEENNGGAAPAEAPAEAAAAPEPAEDPIAALKADPRYSLYFRMLSVRVPPPAVKNKMYADKVPDDIIEQIISSHKP